ncbi:hypothetical protein DWF74_09255 [Pseudomonas protegens]|nr:hypothetical protein DWF74_09255 [Pseudomonas protegens]
MTAATDMYTKRSRFYDCFPTDQDQKLPPPLSRDHRKFLQLASTCITLSLQDDALKVWGSLQIQ